MKTPSTQEPLKAPGSESNFTGLPKRKEDIPITSPSSTNKQMQVSADIAVALAYILLQQPSLHTSESCVAFS